MALVAEEAGAAASGERSGGSSGGFRSGWRRAEQGGRTLTGRQAEADDERPEHVAVSHGKIRGRGGKFDQPGVALTGVRVGEIAGRAVQGSRVKRTENHQFFHRCRIGTCILRDAGGEMLEDAGDAQVIPDREDPVAECGKIEIVQFVGIHVELVDHRACQGRRSSGTTGPACGEGFPTSSRSACHSGDDFQLVDCVTTSPFAPGTDGNSRITICMLPRHARQSLHAGARRPGGIRGRIRVTPGAPGRPPERCPGWWRCAAVRTRDRRRKSSGSGCP